MPGGDRTGPEGQGPRTGRALGFCSGYDEPGWTAEPGYGFGRGRGRGFGRRYWRRNPRYGSSQPTTSQPPQNPTEENLLKQHIQDLEAELSNVKKRLREIEK